MSAYLHLDTILVDMDDETGPYKALGTTYDLTLPGEPQHLHLGICVGTIEDGRDLDFARDALASARLHGKGRHPRLVLPKVKSCLSGQFYLTKI